MSWFSSPLSIPIDDKIIEASSELIPNGEIDLVKLLEISDLIRSKQTLPKDAMRSLKKRFINNKNPNVQKSTLKLIDFCIKNGGEHFVCEISSKEFLDPLVVLLQNKTLNDEVSHLLLELIQNWSLMFSKNAKLSYITTIYDKLSLDGLKFPSIYGAEFNESFLDSKVAPEWVDSDACMICSDLFTVLNRKHHCRACGGVYCGKHSSKVLPLPEFGITIPVRVCDNCFELRKSKSVGKGHHHSHKKSKSRSKVIDEDDQDEDLRKAIELSLKESGMSSIDGPITGSTNGPTSAPQPIAPSDETDDDEDMRRAIEASLRDMNLHSSEAVKVDDNPYLNILPQSSSNMNGYTMPQLQQPVQQVPNGQITMSEEDNINLFANLLERYKNSSDNNIYQDEQIQTLHNNLTALRPKLNKAINDDVVRYDLFSDMHSKIGTIMRLYDGILQAHMSSLYENKQSQTYSQGYQQYPQQGQQYQQQYQQGAYQGQPSTPVVQQQQQQPPQQYPQQSTMPSYPPTASPSVPTTPVVQQQYPPQSAPSYPPTASPSVLPTSPLAQQVPPQAQQPLQYLQSATPSYPPVAPPSMLPSSPVVQQQHPQTAPSYPPSSQLPTSPLAQQVTALQYPPVSTSTEVPSYPPVTNTEVPSYPPTSAQLTPIQSPELQRAAHTPSQEAPSYPSTQAPPQEELKKFDFPGLPNYPAFPEQVETTTVEKPDETPLIEL